MSGFERNSFIEKLLNGGGFGDEPDFSSLRSIPLRVSNDVDGMYFEITRTPKAVFATMLRGGGEWRWQLYAADGALQASSASYETKFQCLAAVDALRVGAARAAIRGANDPITRRDR